MLVGELQEKIMDLPVDILCNIESLEYNGKELIVKVGKSTPRTVKPKKATRADKVNAVRSKIENGDYDFNFPEFAYCLEILVTDGLGVPYVANIVRDTQQIKKVFPSCKSFGEYEFRIIETYVRIFNAIIRTPTYQTPTWGGLVYAMPKVLKNLETPTIGEEHELSEEVF